MEDGVGLITKFVYDPTHRLVTVILPGTAGIDGAGNEIREIPFTSYLQVTKEAEKPDTEG